MREECLICKSPLVYLEWDEEMECAICHRKENSKTRCVNGHYVCNECHMEGLDTIIGLCKESTSKDPVEQLKYVSEDDRIQLAFLDTKLSCPHCGRRIG